MNEGKALQWASMIVPTIIAIIMTIMTFTNKSTTISATTLEKVLQVEQEQKAINDRIDKLDETKVDKEIFNMLKESIDKMDTKLDEVKENIGKINHDKSGK